jgi:hypothetical protein
LRWDSRLHAVSGFTSLFRHREALGHDIFTQAILTAVGAIGTAMAIFFTAVSTYR